MRSRHLLLQLFPISRFSLFRLVSLRCSLSSQCRLLCPSSGSMVLSRRFPSSDCRRYYKNPRTGNRRTPRSAEQRLTRLSDSRSRRTIIGNCAGRPGRIESINRTKVINSFYKYMIKPPVSTNSQCWIKLIISIGKN